MSKAVPESAETEADLEIDLKDPRLAAFLAWLVPGLGHIYQGRTGKGILFSVCILGTFFYGLYIGDGRVVYASTEPFPSRAFLKERWQYLCQLGVGLPALPALVQRNRMQDGKPPLFGPSETNRFLRPPYEREFPTKDPTNPDHVVRHPDELAKWNYELGDEFDIGTVYTVIAGLLNILVIFDAYGGPLVIRPSEDEKKPEEKSPEAAETK